ncbi:AfsR/SARP family transcriptional regulator [Phytohabitans sp. LJ34]|uniref:AfsR/SARP family transcriptional regulator n=1 Tax=Phytohabitans sp. LJ34 TaxID=3452217 RepID=UPI003F8B49AF
MEVFSRDGAVALGGPRGQCIAAALLMEPNLVVSVDRLVAAAWGDNPPATARTQVQNRVSTLRRLLRPDDDGAGAITRQGSGYVIHAGDGQVDAQRFGRLIADADALIAQGRQSAAAAALSSALGLWRGPALDGLHTPALAASAQRLEGERAQALETRIEFDLAAGRQGELLGQLTTLTHAHPYRERLWGFLMLAQYRAGRQEAALATFRHTRALLVEQLGVEPGIELQRLHEAILGGDDDRAASCVLRREALPGPVPVAVSTPPGVVVVPRHCPLM